MAEPVQQGTQDQAPAAVQNNPQGTQQQSQEPAWLTHIPEQHREEAKKSYLLHSDYTKKTSELSSKEKAWEAEKADYQKRINAYDEWTQKTWQPFYQKLEQNWDKINPILQGQIQQAQQAAQDQGNNSFDPNALSLMDQPGWDRVGKYYEKTMLEPAMTAMKQEFNQAMQQREQFWGNYAKILTDAFERKLANPNLDMKALVQKAVEFSYGKGGDPMEMAFQQVMGPAQLKSIEEQAYKKGQEDLRLEQQNKQINPGAMQNQSVPWFKAAPLTRDQVSEAVRNVALKKNIAWDT